LDSTSTIFNVKQTFWIRFRSKKWTKTKFWRIGSRSYKSGQIWFTSLQRLYDNHSRYRKNDSCPSFLLIYFFVCPVWLAIFSFFFNYWMNRDWVIESILAWRLLSVSVIIVSLKINGVSKQMQYKYKNLRCKPMPSEEAWHHLSSEIYGREK